jgi:uncharacterized protein YndB with AHSA1/START domain
METNPPHTGRTIEKEIFIHATPERVFRALTEKAELERWFLTEATVDVRPGGALRFAWQNDVTTGVFREVDPPRRLVYGWEEANGLGMTTITFTLTPEGDGTRLHLVHTGFGSGPQWDDAYAGTDRGWREELERLRAWLDEGTAKVWS